MLELISIILSIVSRAIEIVGLGVIFFGILLAIGFMFEEDWNEKHQARVAQILHDQNKENA